MGKRKGDADGGSSRKKAAVDGGGGRAVSVVNRVKPVNANKLNREDDSLVAWQSSTQQINDCSFEELEKFCEVVISSASPVDKQFFKVDWEKVVPIVRGMGLPWNISKMKNIWKTVSLGRLPVPMSEADLLKNWSYEQEDADEISSKEPYRLWYPSSENWRESNFRLYSQRYQVSRAFRLNRLQQKLLHDQVAKEQLLASGGAALAESTIPVVTNGGIPKIQQDVGFLAWVRENKAEQVNAVLSSVQGITENISDDRERVAKEAIIEEQVSNFYKSLEEQYMQLTEVERHMYKQQGEVLSGKKT